MPKVFDIPSVGEAVILTEDHPPPHVHVLHRGEGWVVRVRFSFLSNIVGFYGVRKAGRRPTERAINGVLDAIEARLPECRAKWWEIHAFTGLEGRWAEMSAGGVVCLPMRKPAQVRRVSSASYDTVMATIAVILDDGTEHRIKAGQGIEEAEEWS